MLKRGIAFVDLQALKAESSGQKIRRGKGPKCGDCGSLDFVAVFLWN